MSTNGLFPKLGLLLIGLLLAPVAQALSPLLGREITDVFPSQSWSSLGRVSTAVEASPVDSRPDTEPAAPEPSVIGLQEPPAAPFELLGEWREQGTRAFVIGHAGDSYIVCGSACAIRGAIFPGQEIVAGYQLEKLSAGGVQITADGGAIYDLPVSGLQPQTH